MPMQNQYHYINQFEIDKEAEKNSWHIRFSDLVPEAQLRFVKGLKKDSSVLTLRRESTKEQDILHVISDLNPILVNTGWRGGFSDSSFFRWRERMLSSAIFNSMFRRIPRQMHEWSMRQMFNTPRDAVRVTHPTFVCRTCGVLMDRVNNEDHWQLNVCRSCVNIERNNANYKEMPRVRRRDRLS